MVGVCVDEAGAGDGAVVGTELAVEAGAPDSAPGLGEAAALLADAGTGG